MSMDMAEIETLTRDVWATMVGLDLVDAIVAGSPEPGISSQIEIQGDSEVVLRIDCSLSLARQVASRLFDMPENEIELDLVMDAMGEMANVLGGNIKGLWPGAVKLSLPLTWETDQAEPTQRSWDVAQAFDASDGQMLVRMSDGGSSS